MPFKAIPAPVFNPPHNFPNVAFHIVLTLPRALPHSPVNKLIQNIIAVFIKSHIGITVLFHKFFIPFNKLPKADFIIPKDSNERALYQSHKGPIVLFHISFIASNTCFAFFFAKLKALPKASPILDAALPNELIMLPIPLRELVIVAKELSNAPRAIISLLLLKMYNQSLQHHYYLFYFLSFVFSPQDALLH